MAEITAFGFRDGAAETVFEDDLRLCVRPVIPDEDPIRVGAFVLYEGDRIVAATACEFYWSSTLSQRMFANRLAAAVEAERQVYRAYRAKRIDEETWQAQFRMFWKVMIKCRTVLGRLSAGAVREVERLEELPGPLEG